MIVYHFEFKVHSAHEVRLNDLSLVQIILSDYLSLGRTHYERSKYRLIQRCGGSFSSLSWETATVKKSAARVVRVPKRELGGVLSRSLFGDYSWYLDDWSNKSWHVICNFSPEKTNLKEIWICFSLDNYIFDIQTKKSFHQSIDHKIWWQLWHSWWNSLRCEIFKPFFLRHVKLKTLILVFSFFSYTF